MNLLVFRVQAPSPLKLLGYMGAFEGIELQFSLWGELLKYSELLKPPPEVGNAGESQEEAMRLSSPEARRVCLAVGVLVKDGAKGAHTQDRGCVCPAWGLGVPRTEAADRQELPEHGWHSPAGLGTAWKLLCRCPSACTHLLQNAAFVGIFFVCGTPKRWHRMAQAAVKVPSEGRKIPSTEWRLAPRQRHLFRNHPAPDPFPFP